MACYLVVFFKGADISFIIDGVDVMAELEDYFDESIEKGEEQRLV